MNDDTTTDDEPDEDEATNPGVTVAIVDDSICDGGHVVGPSEEHVLCDDSDVNEAEDRSVLCCDYSTADENGYFPPCAE